jgi:hypothetical protein
MGRFPKPCLDCGELTSGSNRCVTHENLVTDLHNAKRAAIKKMTGQYSGDYRKRAKLVRETALVCHLCNGGARFSDPWLLITLTLGNLVLMRYCYQHIKAVTKSVATNR